MIMSVWYTEESYIILSVLSLNNCKNNWVCCHYDYFSIRWQLCYPVSDRSVDGVLFSIDFFVYMFLSFFVSLPARLRENGWTDLHEIFRGVEWPWDDLITFLVNSEKPCDAVMCNTGTGFVVLSQHSLFWCVVVFQKWELEHGPGSGWQLIEPVDGFHPNQVCTVSQHVVYSMSQKNPP